MQIDLQIDTTTVRGTTKLTVTTRKTNVLQNTQIDVFLKKMRNA